MAKALNAPTVDGNDQALRHVAQALFKQATRFPYEFMAMAMAIAAFTNAGDRF
ncbi:MAG: hypothetical protein WC023_02030 [Rhodocyclaceae bacterium]